MKKRSEQFPGRPMLTLVWLAGRDLFGSSIVMDRLGAHRLARIPVRNVSRQTGRV